MAYGRMLTNYQKTRIDTAGKIDLVIMSYEKVIQCIQQAKGHFQENQFEQKAHKLQMSIDIINELQSSLNFEVGGQIARNLDALYTYILRSLIDGDIKKDVTVLDDAIRIMSELKNAWEDINKGEPGETSAMDTSETREMNAAQIAA